MNELKLYYPHKPYYVTQNWGNPNPQYSEHFNDPNFKLHNGIDAIGRSTVINGVMHAEHPVYCPVEGFTVHKVQYVPKGGGNEVWFISDKPLVMFERTCYAYMVICHAKRIFVKPGDKLALGELMLIADSTGFSTGLHTHMGLYRVEYDGISVTKYDDQNDATGSFNPALFFTGAYSVDKATVPTLVKSGLRLAQYKVGF